MHVQLPNTEVPIFPLPGAFLFPHQVMPLHIFEPRYRQMVEDLLDSAGRLVIGTLLREPVPAGRPPQLLGVAGLGEILRHQRLEDGRYQILVLGLARVRFEEVPSDRLYRRVRCLPFVEIDAAGAEAEELADRLRAATSARLHQPLPLPESAPPGLLADLLLQTLRAPQAILERAYVEPSVSRRARLVLRAAESGDAAAADGA
ncbi:MAG: LON peptidase substrate-binding domain-containing protein [Planctomycetes bacterium]|nr:LON peptidase substrate-binding domain-containing protein [Planctomycetota bacterium]